MNTIRNRRLFLKTSSLISLGIFINLLHIAECKAESLELIKLSKADKVLISFVQTIIPDVDIRNRRTISHFYDKTLDFKKVKPLFLLQLRRTSKRKYGNANFDELTYEQRMDVIKDGVKGCKLKSKIFTSAIFLTQVAIFCDIYDENHNSELFQIEATEFSGIDPEKIHYARLEGIGARSVTVDGNYN